MCTYTAIDSQLADTSVHQYKRVHRTGGCNVVLFCVIQIQLKVIRQTRLILMRISLDGSIRLESRSVSKSRFLLP